MKNVKDILTDACYGVDEAEWHKYKVTACSNGYFRIVKFNRGVLVGKRGKTDKSMERRPTATGALTKDELDYLSFFYPRDWETVLHRLRPSDPDFVKRYCEDKPLPIASYEDFAYGFNTYCDRLEVEHIEVDPSFSECPEFVVVELIPLKEIWEMPSVIDPVGDSESDEEMPSKRVRHDNINRSRKNFMHLVANNSELWKSFVTLTFADCITDIREANHYFKIWMTQVNRARKKAGKPNLSYIGMSERQKRGAIHYHILCDAVCGDDFPRREHKNLYNKWTREWRELDYYDLPYWNYGYSSAYDISEADENFRVEKYITKYMTKSMEEEGYTLLRSRNLKKPCVFYVDNGEAIEAAVSAAVGACWEDKVYVCEVPENPENEYIQGYMEHNINVSPENLNAMYNILISPYEGTELCNVLKKNRITYNMRSNSHDEANKGKE